MFGLSRKTEYAVTALARLAVTVNPCQAGVNGDNRTDGDEDGDPPAVMSSRTLAEADGTPAALLSGVLKQLQQAGVVCSRRGIRGGYRLAGPPETIRLADVIAAIEGPEPVRLAPCCEQDEPAHSKTDETDETDQTDQMDEDGCPIMCRCPITGAIRQLNQQMNSFLQQLTLADLLESEDRGQKSVVRGQKSESTPVLSESSSEGRDRSDRT